MYYQKPLESAEERSVLKLSVYCFIISFVRRFIGYRSVVRPLPCSATTLAKNKINK